MPSKKTRRRSRRQRTPRNQRRVCGLQHLEKRMLLASEWTNTCLIHDVSGDGSVTAQDALLPINRLQRTGPSPLPATMPSGSPYFDVNGDSHLSAMDALLVINQLNRASMGWGLQLELGLENDTAVGQNNGDHITQDARLVGRAHAASGFADLEMQVDGGPARPVSHHCGSFVFDPGFATDGSQDGPHHVRLTARRNDGESRSIDFEFTLDTTAPTMEVSLASHDDTGLPGDRVTSRPTISLTGSTEPMQSVELVSTGQTTTADSQGAFQFDNIALELGNNLLTLKTHDSAGNETSIQTEVISTPCDFHDDQVVGRFSQEALPAEGDLIPVPDVFEPTLPLVSASEGYVQYSLGLLDQDFLTDFVSLSQPTNEVLVRYGNREGKLGAAHVYPSGGVSPTAVWVDDFIGDIRPDIAIGHRDGTIRFLEGFGNHGFEPRPDIVVEGLGEIVDLTAVDLDQDGETEIVVSGQDRVVVLDKSDSFSEGSGIINGDFSTNLNGWKQRVMGAPTDGVSGRIQVGNNHVQLVENESHLVSLSQDLIIPDHARSLTFDLLDLELGKTDGQLPDVFEVSLVDKNGMSLVSTVHPKATSFVNVNPNGQREFAAGVEVLGNTIALDISSLDVGSEATLHFDLVGNETQTNSSAVIGNVVLHTDGTDRESFVATSLPGNFAKTAGVGHCDVDRDGHPDIVVEDDGADEWLIYYGDGNGNFVLPTKFELNPTAPEGEAVQRQIVIGEQVSDQIQSPGETDVYRFMAQQGQRLFFDAQVTTGLQTWTLRDESGVEQFHSGMVDQDAYLIESTGTYSLSISGVLLAEGPYQFQIHEIPETNSEPIEVGQPVVGQLSVPGQQAEFTFHADAGTSLYFDAQLGTTLFHWTLLDESGVTVFEGPFVDQASTTVAKSGTFTLVLDGEQDTIGDFGFQIHNVTPGPAEPIGLDQEVVGEIRVPGEVDSYWMEGSVGQHVYFDPDGEPNVDFRFEFKDENGNIVANGPLEDHGPLELPSAGVYQIDIFGVEDASGGYGFTVWQLPHSETIDLDLGGIGTGYLRVPGQTQTFQFEGRSGESIIFDEIHPAKDSIRYTLESPTGQLVWFEESGDLDAIELGESGIYTLTVDGHLDATGAFSFQVGRGPIAPPIPDSANLTVTRVETPRNVHGDSPVIEVEWEVQNTGLLEIPAGTEIRHDFHLSGDDQLESLHKDPRVGTFVQVLAVDWNPGESLVLQESVELPAGVDAEFQLVVNVDTDNTVFEGLQEGDNHGSSPTVAYAASRDLVGDPVVSFDLRDGSTLPAGTSITLGGNVSASVGAVNAVFMLDLSGSTRFISGLDANFDGIVDGDDDLNSDGRVGDLLDKQIGLVTETIQRMVETGVDARVAVLAWTQETISFPSGGEVLDLGPDRLNQIFVDPSQPGVIEDLQGAIESLYHRAVGLQGTSGGTLYRDFQMSSGNDYDTALTELLNLLDVAPAADHQQVYFFTDGLYVSAEDQPADPVTIEQVGLQGIQFRAAQVVGPSEIASHCGNGSAADWCGRIEIHDSFVGEVLHITQGIDGVDGSSADAVIASRPEELDDVLLPPVRVAGVTVNDVAVDSLDEAGHFFANVDLQLGPNLFRVNVVDSLGQKTEKHITLIGEDDSLDVSQRTEVTALVDASFEQTYFNRQNLVLATQATLTNRGATSLRGPLRFVLNRIEPPQIELITPHQVDEEGRAWIEMQINELPSGHSTPPLFLEFANAESQRFELDYSLTAIGNTAPVFETNPPAHAAIGADFQYAAFATDGNADDLNYRLRQGPNGITVDPVTGNVRWTPSEGQIGRHVIDLVAEDGWGGSAIQTFQVDVDDELSNRPPLFQTSPLTRIDIGQTYVSPVEAVDLDGDPLEYTLPEAPLGMSIDALSGQIVWEDTVAGTHQVVVQASDGQNTVSQAYALTVGDISSNPSAPRILSTPTLRAAVNQPYIYVPFSQDVDGDSLSYSLIEAPQGMTLGDPGQRIEWIPTADQVGPQLVVIRVDDQRGGFATQSFTIETEREPTNLPPTFLCTPGALASAGELYSYSPEVMDADGDSLTYQLLQAPVGTQVDSTSGTITFTPSDNQLGAHRIQLQVSDGELIGFQAYDLEVRPGPNTPPEFTSSPRTESTLGQTYFYAALAQDADDDVAYELVQAPAGMEVDISSGLLSFHPEPAQLGVHEVILLAIDQRGATAQQAFELEVIADRVPPTISIELSRNPIEPGQSVDIQVLAVDDVAVESIGLEIDGVAVMLDASNQATFTPTQPGITTILATSVDSSGNESQQAQQLRTIDPEDQIPPDIVISAPVPGEQIQYLTEVVGSISGDDLEFYRVDYAPVEAIGVDDLAAPNAAWVTIADSSLTQNNATLATLDPTVLPDGGYLVRVIAQDFSGNTNIRAIPVDVAAPAKLGQFSLDITDLSIPLAGLPIEVTRRYSTLETAAPSDFGYGWSLGLGDPNIRETVAPANDNQIGLFGAAPFVYGTRIYLDNPDGERIGFTFEPERTSSFFGDAYVPVFTPDPGVTERLEVDPITLSQRDDGSFAAFLVAFPYNPDQYRLRRPDGTVYEYDQNVGLEKVTDTNGNELILSEEGITHSSGESIEFKRDALGRISEIVDTSGNSMFYGYDALGNLTNVTDQAGVTTEYRYLDDPGHYLHETIGPTGLVVQRTEYDDQGRVVAVIDADGHRVEQFWDPANFSGTIVDANGNETRLIYDSRGNVVEEQDTLGNSTHYEYGDARHPDLETRVVDRRGYVTRREYDDQGNLISFFEDGHETSLFAEPIVVSWTYNEMGQPTSFVDARGNTTTLRYDESGNLNEITDAAENSVLYTYDSLGMLQTATDSNGNLTSFEYETVSQPSLIRYADGTSQHFEFNSFGQPTSLEIVEADGTIVQRQLAEYDDAGRLIKQIGGAGNEPNAPNLEFRQFFSGDQLDFQALVSPLSVNAAGAFTESPKTPINDRISRVVDREVDNFGRLVQQTGSDGSQTEYRYDANGNRVLLQDSSGNITTWVYDELDRIVETRDPFYNQGMTIDEALVSLEQASGASCDDGQGANHVTVSCYDAEGNLAKSIDRNGRIREFSYDHAGRPTEETWLDSDGIELQSETFVYDVAGNLLEAHDSDSSYVYAYDILNRLVREESHLLGAPGSPRLILTHEYDAEGNRTRTSDDAGVNVHSEYDSRNRLRSRTWSGDSVEDARIDFVHDAADRLVEVMRYADVDATELVSRSEHVHDLAGQDTRISHFDALDRVLADYEYQYNEFAEVVAETTLEGSTDYRYDGAGQLVEAIHSDLGTIDYSYDTSGNRVGDEIVNGVNHQRLADNQFRYEYDGEGNLVEKVDLASGEITRYSYDHDKRLTRAEVIDADGNTLNTTEFIYDVFGRRIATVGQSDAVSTIYHGDNAWTDFDESAAALVHYLYGEEIDQLFARTNQQEGTAWVLRDQLGSVRNVIDSTGSVIAQANYSAFGEPIEITNASALGRFTYTGREWFEELDLLHYRARVYDPSLGQFLSQDPLGFDAGDENLYRYVFNSPTNATDPTGELAAIDYVFLTILAFEIGLAGGGAVGGLAVLLVGANFALYRATQQIELANEIIQRQQKTIETLCERQPGSCRRR